MLKVQDISGGVYNGLADKLRFISEKYRESLLQHPEVRAYAETLVGPGKRPEQAGQMFAALKKALVYVGDPLGFCYQGADVGVEHIKAPWEMVDQIDSTGQAKGDCDDQAALNYTLLRILGIPARVRVVWFGEDEMPGHIYAMAQLNGEWVAFDTTSRAIGYEKPFAQAYDWPQ